MRSIFLAFAIAVMSINATNAKLSEASNGVYNDKECRRDIKFAYWVKNNPKPEQGQFCSRHEIRAA